MPIPRYPASESEADHLLTLIDTVEGNLRRLPASVLKSEIEIRWMEALTGLNECVAATNVVPSGDRPVSDNDVAAAGRTWVAKAAEVKQIAASVCLLLLEHAIPQGNA